MSKKRMNIVYGEKYGDPNDPKTSWKRCGTLFIDEEKGTMSIKLDMVPVSRFFNGWLSVFEQDDRQEPKAETPEFDVDKTSDINIDEIPY